MYREVEKKNRRVAEEQFHRCTPNSPLQADIFLTSFFSPYIFDSFYAKETWQALYCSYVSIFLKKLSCINGEKLMLKIPVS
jgi:hypothetical protein